MFFFVRSDSANVVRVLLDDVRVQVVEELPHFVGVFLVHAEDEGFVVGIRPLQEVRQVFGDGFRPRAEGEAFLELRRVEFLVGDFAAELVDLAFRRTPAGGIGGGDDAMDAVGGEDFLLRGFWQGCGGIQTGPQFVRRWKCIDWSFDARLVAEFNDAGSVG